jgi:hypothetical protein
MPGRGGRPARGPTAPGYRGERRSRPAETPVTKGRTVHAPGIQLGGALVVTGGTERRPPIGRTRGHRLCVYRGLPRSLSAPL